MRKIVSETKTTENVFVTCDLCGCCTTNYSQGCSICGKDTCPSCRYGIDDNSYLDDNFPSFDGDYPTSYICKECWNEGKEFRDMIMDIRWEADSKENSVWDEWRKRKNE
jgi:hypothetical protein